MDFQLVVIRGRSSSKSLKLSNGVTTVGRHDECQLRIGSSQVSRKHCQIFEKDGRLCVIDLGSANGTYVNGKKVDNQQILKPGDVLSLGKVKFRVEKLDGTGRPRPADTAVVEASAAVDEGSSDEFEIDFDEGAAAQNVTPPASIPVKDDTIKVEEEQAAPAVMADDAVADFLLNIDLDDEDKR
jgi:pSer/pThr/pTyr-binding forkhead associated (FHA) protein